MKIKKYIKSNTIDVIKNKTDIYIKIGNYKIPISGNIFIKHIL